VKEDQTEAGLLVAASDVTWQLAEQMKLQGRTVADLWVTLQLAAQIAERVTLRLAAHLEVSGDLSWRALAQARLERLLLIVDQGCDEVDTHFTQGDHS
jgi:hypothetical protein